MLCVDVSCVANWEKRAAIYLCLSQNLHLMEINCTFATAEHPELACPCAVVLATTEISVVAQLLWISFLESRFHWWTSHFYRGLDFWKVDFTSEPAISSQSLLWMIQLSKMWSFSRHHRHRGSCCWSSKYLRWSAVLITMHLHICCGRPNIPRVCTRESNKKDKPSFVSKFAFKCISLCYRYRNQKKTVITSWDELYWDTELFLSRWVVML
jgi:hypothetical protein